LEEVSLPFRVETMVFSWAFSTRLCCRLALLLSQRTPESRSSLYAFRFLLLRLFSLEREANSMPLSKSFSFLLFLSLDDFDLACRDTESPSLDELDESDEELLEDDSSSSSLPM
jgi:hypothetical protein